MCYFAPWAQFACRNHGIIYWTVLRRKGDRMESLPLCRLSYRHQTFQVRHFSSRLWIFHFLTFTTVAFSGWVQSNGRSNHQRCMDRSSAQQYQKSNILLRQGSMFCWTESHKNASVNVEKIQWNGLHNYRPSALDTCKWQRVNEKEKSLKQLRWRVQEIKNRPQSVGEKCVCVFRPHAMFLDCGWSQKIRPWCCHRWLTRGTKESAYSSTLMSLFSVGFFFADLKVGTVLKRICRAFCWCKENCEIPNLKKIVQLRYSQ